MDDASEAVVAQGGMPSGDEAERALSFMRGQMTFAKLRGVHAIETENVYRCLIAFLALMRMHEAKQEHGIAEKPEH